MMWSTMAKGAGKTLADLQKQIDDSVEARIVRATRRLNASLTVSVQTTRATVNNVLAYLPGKTDEYVIIGAHYDHGGAAILIRWRLRRSARFIPERMTTPPVPPECSNWRACSLR